MRPNYDDPDTTPDRYGLSIGVVVDRDDPRGWGRVRVRVPGLLEPASAWARPLGAPGGGFRDRGVWWIPELGAEVGVLLNRGDPDHPYYLPAQWGAPGGSSEVPTNSDGGDPDVRVMAFGSYDLVVDTRSSGKKLQIVDRSDTENVIEFDGSSRTLKISATTGIEIESTGQISINGLIVEINGIIAGFGQL